MASLEPGWPAPVNIKVLFSDRRGGCSHAPYASLNLGSHVGDDAALVTRNRASIDVPGEPYWLEQTHTDICVNADMDATDRLGDASITRERGKVLAIMVADCLPVMFTSRGGDIVGIAHAGWRGLANGVLSSTVMALGSRSMLAWMGPAIGPCHYTVGENVRACFSSGTGFALKVLRMLIVPRVSSRWIFMRLQTNSYRVWVLKSTAVVYALIVIRHDFFLTEGME